MGSISSFAAGLIPFRIALDVLAEARADKAKWETLYIHRLRTCDQQDTQQMTDGELFYIIQNGIRLRGMPAWGAEHGGEEYSWKLVRFIRRLPNLSPSELQGNGEAQSEKSARTRRRTRGTAVFERTALQTIHDRSSP